MSAELLQYNIDYDKYEEDSAFIMTQLETHLRERFNVLISTVEYEIVDGHLVRPGQTEPFINSIKRGRDLLRKFATNPEDFEREDAEVIGFEEAIDPILADPNTPLGTKILNISLPSGKYKHRFHDVGTVKERNERRYVEYSRFSSALLAEEYAEVIPGFDPQNSPTPAQFLRNPYVITDTKITAEEIHRILHKDHEFMPVKDFNEIWDQVKDSEFVKNYISNKDAVSFNSILNFADDVSENIKRRREGLNYRDYNDTPISYQEKKSIQNREVRQASTACPGKSGAEVDNSPFSVSEFDIDYAFDQPGPCKTCGEDISCGPCGICKPCDLRIRREENLRKVA